MRALVTGGAGFIGSHLVDHLVSAGHQVSVIDNLSSGHKSYVPDVVTLHTIDIAAADAVAEVVRVERPEVIFHLAAQISVRESVTDPVFDADTNVLGAVKVLEAARAVDARIVFASTGGAIYGDNVSIPTPETQLPRTEAPYGIAKYCAEQYLALYNRLYGTQHVALRLGNVYGPRQDPHGEAGVIAIFCGKIANGESPTVFGDGHQTRDYIYVADVVTAFAAAASYAGAHSVFNIGTETGTSVMQLLGALNAAAGTSITAHHAPQRPGEVRDAALDTSRAAAELGWAPSTAIADGIGLTYHHLTG